METQQWEYNEWIPWQQQMNEIAAQRYAGQGMQTSGSDTMAAAGVTAANMLSNQ
jgi:hypothetical protein